MPHALLIAMIFIPYMGLMTGLFAYFCSQALRHESGDARPDSEEGEIQSRDDAQAAARAHPGGIELAA